MKLDSSLNSNEQQATRNSAMVIKVTTLLGSVMTSADSCRWGFAFSHRRSTHELWRLLSLRKKADLIACHQNRASSALIVGMGAATELQLH